MFDVTIDGGSGSLFSVLPFSFVVVLMNPANFKFSWICCASFDGTRTRPLGFNSFNMDAKNGISRPSFVLTITNVNVESPYDAEIKMKSKLNARFCDCNMEFFSVFSSYLAISVQYFQN